MVKIRRATQRDFGQYLELKKCDILEYSKIIGEKINVAQDDQIKKEFGGMLKSRGYVIFVAEEDGRLVGYLGGSVIKNIWQYSGYVDDIFVTSDFKRVGIGRGLIKAFIGFLKTKKIKKCKLGVNVKNKNAIRLYKKLGFKIYHYEMGIDL